MRRLADELPSATLETGGQAIFAEAMEGKETKTCTSDVRKAAKCVGHIYNSSFRMLFYGDTSGIYSSFFFLN